MYRDDPLDDEAELREVIGDGPVEDLQRAEADLAVTGLVATAFDALSLLRGWTPEAQTATWFAASQARLDGRTPIEALCDGDIDEVLDAARHFVAAQG